MRSDIAQKILDETPPETSDFVRKYGDAVVENRKIAEAMTIEILESNFDHGKLKSYEIQKLKNLMQDTIWNALTEKDISYLLLMRNKAPELLKKIPSNNDTGKKEKAE